MSGRRCAVAAVTLALVYTHSARAADPVTSEALFRNGRAAMEAGRYAEACARFAESHRLDPAAGTLLNLGECHEALGELASAWQSYLEAADMLGGDERRPYADGKRRELEAKLARVTIDVDAAAPEGCSVSRDGTTLGAGGTKLPLPIDAGTHRFELHCAGRVPGAATLAIRNGESRTVLLHPGAMAKDRPTGSAGPARGPGLLAAGLVVGGIGLLAVGAGTVTGILAIDRKGTVDHVCPVGPDGGLRCPPDGLAAASEGSTFATVSTVTMIGGGIAIAGSIALIVADALLTVPEPVVRVGVTAGATGAAIGFVGRF
jgi:hypothetical protein